MDGNNFDLCECFLNHNMVMRRLLSILRQSQAYCTDNECLTELPGNNIQTEPSNFLIFFCWLMFCLVMYYMRPESLRRRREDVQKLRNNENDSSDNSSAPPPLL